MRYLISLVLCSYISYIAASLSIVFLLDNWLAAPAWLRGSFLTNDYLAHVLTVRYQYSGTVDGWAGPDSGVEAIAIAASALAGWVASRVLPFSVSAEGRGLEKPSRLKVSLLWARSRRLRGRWRARSGLMIGLLIGALGAIGGALIDKSVYDAREKAYWSQWAYVTDPADLSTWPTLPSPAHGVIGWLTPADASIILPGIFLVSAASVLVPTWRVVRGSAFFHKPRCGRCRYQIHPRPGTDRTTCPECGHANPTLSELHPAHADRG